MKISKNKKTVLALLIFVAILVVISVLILQGSNQNIDRGQCSTVQGDGFIGPKGETVEVCP